MFGHLKNEVADYIVLFQPISDGMPVMINKKKGPDATLTKITQLAYGPSLGFPEAKVVKPTTIFFVCWSGSMF